MEYSNTIWGVTSSWRENKRILVAQNIIKPIQDLDNMTGGRAIAKFADLGLKILEWQTNEN